MNDAMNATLAINDAPVVEETMNDTLAIEEALENEINVMNKANPGEAEMWSTSSWIEKENKAMNGALKVT